MAQRIVKYRLLILIICFLGIHFSVNAQSIKKTSNNRKDQFKSNYILKKSANDTLIIIFNMNTLSTSFTQDIHYKNVFDFKYIKYSRKYPNLDSCVLLEFYHMAGPHQGHEEYLIHKNQLIKKDFKILLDEELNFLFWFKNESELMDKTLILVSEKDWKKGGNVNGLGVQISTFGSCRDLIENL